MSRKSKKKTDVKVSTVAKVVEALGGSLHLVAVLPGQEAVTLRFGEDGITARQTYASVPRVPRRSRAAAAAASVSERDTGAKRHRMWETAARSGSDEVRVAAGRKGTPATATRPSSADEGDPKPPKPRA